MRKKKVTNELDYLQRKPIKLIYKIVAGTEDIRAIQLYDLIFDEYDLRIRKLDTVDNLLYLRQVQGG